MSDCYYNPIEEIEKSVNIETLKQTAESEENGLCLFISFDMVNSTSLKINKKNEWLSIVIYFYEAIASEIRVKLPKSEIWKYLGDEIILYYNVKDIKKLYTIPDEVYTIQKKIVEKIHQEFHNKNINIKSTMWLAGIKYMKTGPISGYQNLILDDVYRNIKIKINSNDKVIEDFLGPDIDIGFRISKYSYKLKIVLSVELAYLLYCLDKPQNIEKIDKNLKIVTFQELKGVWENRAYPIIWYYQNWENVGDIFDYDEHIKNDMVRNISQRKDIEYLEKVLTETGKMEYINKFIETCKWYNKEDDEQIVMLK